MKWQLKNASVTRPAWVGIGWAMGLGLVVYQ
jgi:hypothetical protein